MRASCPNVLRNEQFSIEERKRTASDHSRHSQMLKLIDIENKKTYQYWNEQENK